MGTQPSRGMTFRWENSEAEEEEGVVVDDEEADATAAGSGSRLLEGGQVSGPAAQCSASPAAAACSDSWVGEEGGEGRDFFLLEDSSLRRLFFSFCGRQQWQKHVIEQRSSTATPKRLNTDATTGRQIPNANTAGGNLGLLITVLLAVVISLATNDISDLRLSQKKQKTEKPFKSWCKFIKKKKSQEKQKQSSSAATKHQLEIEAG